MFFSELRYGPQKNVVLLGLQKPDAMKFRAIWKSQKI